ncbi:MAG: hypothetical protein KAX77_05140 [Xanthomonadales bacterium]|nr:hypothetical protein [Xanthomonadales bacterium]
MNFLTNARCGMDTAESPDSKTLIMPEAGGDAGRHDPGVIGRGGFPAARQAVSSAAIAAREPQP